MNRMNRLIFGKLTPQWGWVETRPDLALSGNLYRIGMSTTIPMLDRPEPTIVMMDEDDLRKPPETGMNPALAVDAQAAKLA